MTACAIGTAVSLREARFEDHGAIAALEASGGLKPKKYDDWRRLWEANPTYRERTEHWPIGWVLETGGRIVGCLSNVPLTYEFRGRKLLVAAGRGWTVEEAYRSYALLLMDRYFDQPSVDVFLNTTVNARAAEAFAVFGSRKVPAGNWDTAAFFVTGYAGFAESALRIKNWKFAKALRYPMGLALWTKDLAQSRRHTTAQVKVEMAGGFEPRFDHFWERLRASSGLLLGVRSSEALNWHFATYSATRLFDADRLWVLTASRGTLGAYAVFQRKDEERYGLKRMRLVDFQALDSHQEFGAAILDYALALCRANGIHSLEKVGAGLANTQWFEQRAPYRRTLPHWSSYYFVRDAALAEQLANPAVWDPSSFDGDASL